MILMDAMGDFVSPNGSTSDEFGAVAFAKKDIAVFQAIFGHILVWHVDRFYLCKVET